MVRLVLTLVLLGAAAGGWFFTWGPAAHAPLDVVLRPEARKLGALARGFLEAIRFKDFEAAAGFSSPEDRKAADIPRLIERLFQVKPELLQLDNIELLAADVDETGRRARTKLKADLKVLNTAELRHPEVLLYWKKAGGERWYMDLAGSLQ
ncbi:MAG: hypothetical protein VKQ33_04420 [Candidatus Sericytochromatia bacterium]|nr:hypothetical protein [Candidatus Sericytochromatia bacterium]